MAARAGISVETIKRLERTVGPISANTATAAAIQRALESAGVEFIPENGGGPGVRLRKGKAAGDHPKLTGPATDAIGAMEEAIAKDRSAKPTSK